MFKPTKLIVFTLVTLLVSGYGLAQATLDLPEGWQNRSLEELSELSGRYLPRLESDSQVLSTAQSKLLAGHAWTKFLSQADTLSNDPAAQRAWLILAARIGPYLELPQQQQIVKSIRSLLVPNPETITALSFEQWSAVTQALDGAGENLEAIGKIAAQWARTAGSKTLTIGQRWELVSVLGVSAASELKSQVDMLAEQSLQEALAELKKAGMVDATEADVNALQVLRRCSALLSADGRLQASDRLLQSLRNDPHALVNVLPTAMKDIRLALAVLGASQGDQLALVAKWIGDSAQWKSCDPAVLSQLVELPPGKLDEKAWASSKGQLLKALQELNTRHLANATELPPLDVSRLAIFHRAWAPLLSPPEKAALLTSWDPALNDPVFLRKLNQDSIPQVMKMLSAMDAHWLSRIQALGRIIQAGPNVPDNSLDWLVQSLPRFNTEPRIPDDATASITAILRLLQEQYLSSAGWAKLPRSEQSNLVNVLRAWGPLCDAEQQKQCRAMLLERLAEGRTATTDIESMIAVHQAIEALGGDDTQLTAAWSAWCGSNPEWRFAVGEFEYVHERENARLRHLQTQLSKQSLARVLAVLQPALQSSQAIPGDAARFVAVANAEAEPKREAWLKLVDQKIEDPAIVGDLKAQWLLARAFTEEAVPDPVPTIAGMTWANKALTAAQTPAMRLSCLEYLVGRHVVTRQLGKAMAMQASIEAQFESSDATSKQRIAQWKPVITGAMERAARVKRDAEHVAKVETLKGQVQTLTLQLAEYKKRGRSEQEIGSIQRTLELAQGKLKSIDLQQ